MVSPALTEGVEGLFSRARMAASPEERSACLQEIEVSLSRASGAVALGRLLICRARLLDNQWQTPEALQDVLAAVSSFEQGDEPALALDATSLACALAARSGQVSLAAELATRSVRGLPLVDDDGILADIATNLGMFCEAFLDFERGVQQVEIALAAAERAGDTYQTCLELNNLAAFLFAAVRARRNGLAGEPGSIEPEDAAQLELVERVLHRLAETATPGLPTNFSIQLLQVQLLLARGQPLEALEVVTKAVEATRLVADEQKAELDVLESGCLRALGRYQQAVVVAERAVGLARSSGNDAWLLLTLEERIAARRAAGDLEGALTDALEARATMWRVHQRQSVQVAEEVWVRAALEQERHQLEERTAAAVQSSEEDALTGIGNRRLLERFLATTGKDPATVALIMTDIDYFKKVNDTFGHDVGDLVLRSLAELFAAETRPGQVVVRYGGEEFVFALLGTELRTAANFAERVRRKVASFRWDDLGVAVELTVSLGVASGSSEAWRSVLAAADRALYLAKRRGRNRVEMAPRVLVKKVS